MQRAGIANLRIHDLRHTAVTRLMRAKGNLKLVQQLLRHGGIASTSRYAHVTQDDLRLAMEEVAAIESPEKFPNCRRKQEKTKKIKNLLKAGESIQNFRATRLRYTALLTIRPASGLWLAWAPHPNKPARRLMVQTADAGPHRRS